MSTYFANGYKFHTEEWSKNKKTINSGVWVKGDDGDQEYEVHSEGIYEEVDLSVEQNYGMGTSMANAEEHSGDENEFIEEEEFSDENETSEEDETDDENVASDDDGMDDGNETSDDDN
uniref:Mitotic apparatus protein p62-like n=2 Tax=Nicotiana TaxID=4085 RepID=A0A1S3XLC9_TOBAC|nr:PREDICTED: mitotic apparatus protein p62-like [Nicotiana sylvestris]XP_016440723.1 PREDICTED: mitotic apparatus protein p62-like [Nicotiana tabacum]